MGAGSGTQCLGLFNRRGVARPWAAGCNDVHPRDRSSGRIGHFSLILEGDEFAAGVEHALQRVEIDDELILNVCAESVHQTLMWFRSVVGVKVIPRCKRHHETVGESV